MAYRDFKGLPRRTIADKIPHAEVSDIAKKLLQKKTASRFGILVLQICIKQFLQFRNIYLNNMNPN